MKKIVCILMFFSLALGHAQNPNDCVNAIEVCGDLPIGILPDGFGIDEFSLPGNPEPPCNYNFANASVWFKFNITGDGSLAFDLAPDNKTDDYDFAIYKSTDCSNLGEVVRCSTTSPWQSADHLPNAVTGLSLTEEDLEEGPGPNGNGYVRYIDAVAGETYYMIVERAHGAGSFKIEMTGTAQLPASPGFNVPSGVSVLDDDECTSDQRYTFDLGEQRDSITAGFPDSRVSFHLSLNDANIGINSIPDEFTNSSNPQTVYARIYTDDGNCTEITEITYKIETTARLNYPQQVNLCDPALPYDYDLNALRQQLQEGDVRNLSINFHNTFEEAINLENPLDNLVVNTFPATIFISTELSDDPEDCPAVNPLTLRGAAAPFLGRLQDIYRQEVCEPDGEQIEVDLTSQRLEALSGRNPDLFEVRFYATEADRENRVAPLPLIWSTTDKAQTIYVALTDLGTGCFSYGRFFLLSTPIFDFNRPFDLFSCINNAEEETATFDLATQADRITYGFPDTSVSFHSSKDDAVYDKNALPSSYQSAGAGQEIFARIFDVNSGCFRINSFRLQINPLLEKSNPTPENIYLCEAPANMMYSLTHFRDQLQLEDSQFTYTFYTTASDAHDQNNPIDELPVLNEKTAFYVRTEYSLNPNLCPLIEEVNLVLQRNLIPGAVAPIDACIPENSSYTLDLATPRTIFLDGRSPDDFDVFFYASEQDRETETNPEPNFYNLQVGRHIFYGTLRSRSSNCEGYGQFQVTVRQSIEYTAPSDLLICNPELPLRYDLTPFKDQLTTENPDLKFTFYENSIDAQQSENAVNEIVISTLPFTLYIVPENPDAALSCGSVGKINVKAVDPPDLDLTFEVGQSEICDSTIDQLTLNLEQISDSILSDLEDNAYELRFFATETDREQNINTLPETYLTDNKEQSLYLTLYEKATGCYTEGVVHIVPGAMQAFNPPQDLTACDGFVADGAAIFDLAAQRDAISAGFADVDVHFFTSIEDAENDANPLPLRYTNTSPLDTIYSRIFTQNASCVAIESFTVSINPVLAKNSITPPVIYICEPDYPQRFPLDGLLETLINQEEDLNYTFYASEENAYNGQNPITEMVVNNKQTVFYVKTEDPSNAKICPLIERVLIESTTSPIPGVAAPLQVCDNTQPFIDVDLNSLKQAILDGRSPLNFEVLLFRSQDHLENGATVLPDLLTLPATDYTFIAKLTDLRTGCFATTPVTIQTLNSPSFEMDDQVYCIDSGLPYTLLAPEDFVYYSWSTGEEGPGLDAIQVEAGGTYSVTLTNAANCQTTRSLTLKESTAPTIETIAVTAFQYPNNTVTIDANGAGDYVYALDDGPFQQSNVFTSVSRGYHTVTVKDINGCGSVSEEILVLEYTRIITPNGDGVNDVFKIIGLKEYPGSQVTIFDRYGKLITILNSNTSGWDGTYNGRPAFMTDYWFVLTIPDGTSVRGHFSLIR